MKIDSLPGGWKTVRLQDTDIEIIDGDRGSQYPKKHELLKQGFCAFLNNKNLIGDKVTLRDADYISEQKDSQLRKGKVFVNDIIITTRGSVGNVGLFSEELGVPFARINSGMVILRNKTSDIDQFFLYQLLKSPMVKSQFASLSTGSAQPQLPIRDLRTIELVLPPIEVQKALASIGGHLDGKIELNLRMNETLEQMAMTLYKHWFVDLESDEEVTVGELIDLNPRYKVKQGEEMPFVSMQALPTNSLSIADKDVIHRHFTSGPKFQYGDTLLARITPSLENGKTAYVDFLEEGVTAFGSTEFLVLKPKPGIAPQYIYCLARSESFRQNAIQSMVGTSGRQRAQNSAIEQFILPSPDSELMGRFEALSRKWFQMIRSNTVEIGHLESLRDYLLPRLLSGGIELKEAEEQVNEVV